MNLQSLATCLFLLTICSQAIAFDDTKLSTGKRVLQSKRFQVFTKYGNYSLAGSWPANLFVFTKPPDGSPSTFHLLDSKAMSRGVLCVVYSSNILTLDDCDSDDTVLWEMKDERLYGTLHGYDYDMCLSYYQSSPIKMATLGDCDDRRSKLVIKYV